MCVSKTGNGAKYGYTQHKWTVHTLQSEMTPELYDTMAIYSKVYINIAVSITYTIHRLNGCCRITASVVVVFNVHVTFYRITQFPVSLTLLPVLSLTCALLHRLFRMKFTCGVLTKYSILPSFATAIRIVICNQSFGKYCLTTSCGFKRYVVKECCLLILM
jgi:hypothetical protein